MSEEPNRQESPRVRGNAASDVTLTVDTFIAEVPIEPHRCILVYLRQHGGKQYVRWRVFHKHKTGGNWYPDKRRAFVLPVGIADALASAITSAATGEVVTAKPAWLEAIDAYQEHRLACLRDLNAPPAVQECARRQRIRGWGMGPPKRGKHDAGLRPHLGA